MNASPVINLRRDVPEKTWWGIERERSDRAKASGRALEKHINAAHGGVVVAECRACQELKNAVLGGGR